MVKSTVELENEISKADNIEVFIAGNNESFLQQSFSEYLTQMLIKYDLNKSAVFRRADMIGDNYGYEMFNKDNKKKFSRDKVIRLSLGFPLSIDETQMALRLAGANQLYARNKRDAVIMMGIHKQLDATNMNDTLSRLGEAILQ